MSALEVIDPLAARRPRAYSPARSNERNSMSETTTRRLWVAHGPNGVVGKIQKDAEGYAVHMAGKDERLGVYPTMEIAKNALHSHLKPGSERPEFREH